MGPAGAALSCAVQSCRGRPRGGRTSQRSPGRRQRRRRPRWRRRRRRSPRRHRCRRRGSVCAVRGPTGAARSPAWRTCRRRLRGGRVSRHAVDTGLRAVHCRRQRRRHRRHLGRPAPLQRPGRRGRQAWLERPSQRRLGREWRLVTRLRALLPGGPSATRGGALRRPIEGRCGTRPPLRLGCSALPRGVRHGRPSGQAGHPRLLRRCLPTVGCRDPRSPLRASCSPLLKHLRPLCSRRRRRRRGNDALPYRRAPHRRWRACRGCRWAPRFGRTRCLHGGGRFGASLGREGGVAAAAVAAAAVVVTAVVAVEVTGDARGAASMSIAGGHGIAGMVAAGGRPVVAAAASPGGGLACRWPRSWLPGGRQLHLLLTQPSPVASTLDRWRYVL